MNQSNLALQIYNLLLLRTRLILLLSKMLSTLQSNLQANKVIGDYTVNLQQVLGKGNFSTVYRGQCISTGEQVAIKMIKLSSLVTPKLKQLLSQQIAIVKALNHPNVLKCYEVYKSINHCYIVSELCQGGTLDSGSHLNVTSILQGVLSGMQYLRFLNIIHRDIKTTNVFLKMGVPKIADFGFAVVCMTNGFYDDSSIGSPLYMSPQSIGCQYYSHKSDVWAFGILIYQMLHGKTPLVTCMTDDQVKKQVSIQIKDDQIAAHIAPQLRQIILNCLNVVQQNRIAIEQISHSSLQAQQGYCGEGNRVFKPLSFENHSNIVVLEQKENPRRRMHTMVENNAFSIKKNKNTASNIILKKTKDNKQRIKTEGIERSVQKSVNKKIFMRQNLEEQKKQCQLFINAPLSNTQTIGLVNLCRLFSRISRGTNNFEFKRRIGWFMKNILTELNSRNIENISNKNNNIIQCSPQNIKVDLIVKKYLQTYHQQLNFEKRHFSQDQFLVLLKYIRKTIDELQNIIETNKKLFTQGYYCLLAQKYLLLFIKCRDEKSFKLFSTGINLQKQFIIQPNTVQQYTYLKRQISQINLQKKM